MNATKITCSRCNGSGNFSFNLVRGTVCFGCEGTGFQIVDAKKHATKLARAAAAKSAKQADMDERIARANAAAEARRVRYENDPRIGPATLARCAEFEAVAHELYKGLDDFDNQGAKVHASWFTRISA